jgi:hypothetical protein
VEFTLTLLPFTVESRSRLTIRRIQIALLTRVNPMPKQNENEIVRIELTPTQKEKVKNATDKTAEAIELTVQELEARIAPRMVV